MLNWHYFDCNNVILRNSHSTHPVKSEKSHPIGYWLDITHGAFLLKTDEVEMARSIMYNCYKRTGVFSSGCHPSQCFWKGCMHVHGVEDGGHQVEHHAVSHQPAPTACGGVDFLR